MTVIDRLRKAFESRVRPSKVHSEQVNNQEMISVEYFLEGLYEGKVDKALLQENHDAIYWLSPDAFCYYLPRIIEVSLYEGLDDLIAVEAIISMLDRSPSPEFWDDFFLSRFTLLSYQECESMQSWVLFLLENTTIVYNSDSLARAFDTLQVLKFREPLKTS